MDFFTYARGQQVLIILFYSLKFIKMNKSTKTTLAILDTAITALISNMQTIDLLWDETAVEPNIDLNDMLQSAYPFTESFDELTLKAEQWLRVWKSKYEAIKG